MRDGMKIVRIAKAGRYNDGDGKAADYEVGDELETLDWYAQALVAEGMAEWPVISAAEAIALEEARADASVILLEVLPVDVVAMLASWKIRTLEDVRAATDQTLLKVPGIGPGRLKKLRALVE